MQTLDSSLSIEVKDVGEDGLIEGFAATYGNVDDGGDVILPGAFTKTLKGRSSLPMLLYHDTHRPIGVWNAFEDTAKGLRVKGRIVTETQDGAQAHVLARAGAIAGLSIGYSTVKQRAGDRTRELIELGLHEVSLTPTPMNSRATITRVKEIEDLRDRIAAGDRLTAREWEVIFRKEFGLSNAEAERAVRVHGLKAGPGEPGDEARAFWEALRR